MKEITIYFIENVIICDGGLRYKKPSRASFKILGYYFTITFMFVKLCQIHFVKQLISFGIRRHNLKI